MPSILSNPKFQAFNSAGAPLVGGKLYTYQAGTTTPKATYTSSTLAAQNTNPVILDARGEADVWLNGTYKFILKDPNDVTIWTLDNVSSYLSTYAETLLIYSTVAVATAASIPETATYLAIAEFSPQPRFYKRFSSDPGSGDRFQSADGAWWQGQTLPPTALDFANAVERTANATLVEADLDQVHRWTIPIGTTYTATLPDPDDYLGSLLHLEMSADSRGLLALACADPIGLFVTGDLVLWAGESMTLVARTGRWEIIGGRCVPCTLYATRPGSSITLTDTTVTLDSGWITSQGGSPYSGAEHAINGSGQLKIPRRGFYRLAFDVYTAWATAPTYTYATCNSSSGIDADWRGAQAGSGQNAVLHATDDQAFNKDALLSPKVTSAGGTTVTVGIATNTPRFKIVESPLW